MESLNCNIWRDNLSPLSQFEIRDLINIDTPVLWNLHISVTNIGFYLTIGAFFLLVTNLLSTNYNKLVSNNWSISMESLYATIHSIVTNQINPRNGQIYFPFIYTLFIFILINNLIGMVKRCLCILLLFISNNPVSFGFFRNRRKKELYSSHSHSYIHTIVSKNNPRYSFNNNNTFFLNPDYITGFVDGEGCFSISIFKDSRRYSTEVLNEKLDPNYVTGFTDGEGSFIIKLIKSNKLKTGYEVRPCFQITNHLKDRVLLESIQKFFGGIGSISQERENTLQYSVSSKKDLNVIINHFDKYPLATKKYADFLLFKSAVELCNNKEHLTESGLLKIVAIKASLNKGMTEDLKLDFPNVIPASRPEVANLEIKNPNWVRGFIEAEGNFHIGIFEQDNNTKVQLKFNLAQHNRDEDLIHNFVKYFKGGLITKTRDITVFDLSKIEDLNALIIPFFEKYPLLGSKSLDFMDWCEANKLIQNKEHLTKFGLEKLKLLKNNVQGRKEI